MQPGPPTVSASARGLRRYWWLTLALLGFFLALFAVVDAAGVDVLRDPSAQLGRGGLGAAALSFSLLVADVFLPVPSSVVMIGNGALFGIVGGTALSLGGSVGAAALGFAVGRKSGALIERLVSPAEKARADAMLARWGALAVVVSRPIPLLSETIAILAGASPLGWARMMGATVAGALPSCLLYALTGATSRSFGSGVLMFAVVLLVAGALYLLGRKVGAPRG